MAANNKDERIWSAAVRRAVLRRMDKVEGKPQKLERLADELVDQGLAGSTSALKEIGDRLDGKSTQQLEGNLNLGLSGDMPRLFQSAKSHEAKS